MWGRVAACQHRNQVVQTTCHDSSDSYEVVLVRYAATTHDSASTNVGSTLSSIPVTAPQANGPAARRAETARLVGLMAQAATPAARTVVEDELITVTMPVASDVARRYHDRGIPSVDIDQVAFLGLIKAARGFDPDKGSDFLSFAVPTIRGEIRRHFRDQGWAVRPPRRVQELQPRLTEAEAVLCQRLGRSPRPSEMAEYLDAPLEDVLESLSANGCFSPTSLDAPTGGEADVSPIDLLGGVDPDFAGAEARAALRPLLKGLSDRERMILEMRFCRGLTQREIGEAVGVTQMQISRVLAQVLGRLRERLVVEGAA